MLFERKFARTGRGGRVGYPRAQKEKETGFLCLETGIIPTEDRRNKIQIFGFWLNQVHHYRVGCPATLSLLLLTHHIGVML